MQQSKQVNHAQNTAGSRLCTLNFTGVRDDACLYWHTRGRDETICSGRPGMQAESQCFVVT